MTAVPQSHAADHPDTVGAPVRAARGAEKLSGRAQYIADLYRPGMLHGAILQSPACARSHPRLRPRRALALPGVRAIVTGDDVDARRTAWARSSRTSPRWPRTRCATSGEIVAAVAADTEAIARQAVRLIDVDYEELPASIDPEAALAPGAPLVHEDSGSYARVFDAGTEGNLCSRTSFQEGDVGAAWAGCDVVVEGTYRTQAQAHLSIEPCGALAEVDAAGRMTLWSANQSVFRVQANVCESLGPADDQAALPDAAYRRGLRQQDGSARAAGAGAARAQGQENRAS